MQKAKGFTLVELIVVIVILGILAATALPRFVNFGADARAASVQGLAGGMRAAVALVQSRWVATGNNASTTVTMADGTAVTVAAGTGLPTGAAAGIGAAMQSMDGYTAVYGATSTFTPNGGSATCQVTYVAATGAVTAIPAAGAVGC